MSDVFMKIFAYDNIAIVICFVIILMQWGVINKLLMGLLSMKDVLNELTIAITTLNERLDDHD